MSVAVALVFEKLFDLSFNGPDPVGHGTRYFGSHNQGVVDLVEGVVGDCQLDFRLGILSRILAFQIPGGTLPAFGAVPGSLTIACLARHLGTFYGGTELSGSGALNCFTAKSNVESDLLVGKAEEEKLCDLLLDCQGSSWSADLVWVLALFFGLLWG